MDLKLNEDQTMMKKVAADFLKAEAPPYVITEWFQKKNLATGRCRGRIFLQECWRLKFF